MVHVNFSIILFLTSICYDWHSNAFTTPISVIQHPSIQHLGRLLEKNVPVRNVSIHSTASKDSDVTTSVSIDEVDSHRESNFANQALPRNKIHRNVAIPYEELTIGVLKETFPGEKRVSQSPDSVSSLVKSGFKVVVQLGGERSHLGSFTAIPFFNQLIKLLSSCVVYADSAGESASFPDSAYVKVGAAILSNANQIYDIADIITKIRPPELEEVPKLAGKTLISTIQPAINTDLYKQLSNQNTNVFALDCVPRMLSRGQSYDTLSSQANIAGYRAGKL
jgi:Alanine dehydrogenase/PNT, N-terminal domain